MPEDKIVEATVQLPRQMSTVAADIDQMYYFIFWVSVVFFVVTERLERWVQRVK